MKTLLMTAFFMTLSLGLNHSLSAHSLATQAQQEFLQTLEMEEFERSTRLKYELTQSVQTLTQGVRQTAMAVVDVVIGVIAYVFLLIGQIFSSIVLDKTR